MTYREHRARGPLLACTWSRGSDRATVARVVPDACTDVMWHRESGELVVAGPDTRAHLHPGRPGTMVGVRFAPGNFALGVAAHELRDARVPLADLWGDRDTRLLADALAATSGVDDARAVLERRFGAGEPDPLAAEVRTLAGSMPTVATIAARMALSERQLHRRCLAAFGYGPKVLHRVLRFDRAVRSARAGRPFAEVAHAAGYADQAHLSREVRALAGAPLSELVGQSRP